MQHWQDKIKGRARKLLIVFFMNTSEKTEISTNLLCVENNSNLKKII